MKAFQARQCTEVSISSTSFVQCGGTLYERDAFLGALVSFNFRSAIGAPQSLRAQ